MGYLYLFTNDTTGCPCVSLLMSAANRTPRCKFCCVVGEGNVCTSATAEPVACSAMSMAFFDRLYDNGIVRETGHIVKCFDEFCEELIVSDELRKVAFLRDVLWLICAYFNNSNLTSAFSALTLLVGRQEEHPVCKN